MNDMSNPSPTVDDVNRLALAAREALTDQMIERFATTGGNALELLDRLTEMHKVGALDTACDMVMLLQATRNALTDQMVERLATYAEYMVTSVANEDVCDLVTHACQAMNEAADESAKAPARGGLMATIALLSKPETQRSLQFLMNFANKLQTRPCADR